MSRAAVFANPTALRSQTAARNALAAIQWAVAQAEFIGMHRLAQSFKVDETRLRVHMAAMGWTDGGKA